MSATDAPVQLEQSIEIAASPAQVWALVSDVRRMAQWSPQVVRSVVLGGSVREGASFVNLNRSGLLFWPTTATVVRFTPHADFAFRIPLNRTVWSFALEPVPVAGVPGTRLTQRRETPEGISATSNALVGVAMGGSARFADELTAGMRQTLERIKAEAER